jgi:PAS domain S-box-containing protein
MVEESGEDQELQRELERLRARVAILEQVDAERQAIAADNVRLLREAQHARAQHQYLFEGIADAILLADSVSRYIDANPAAERLLGYSRDELLSLRIADIVAYQPAWTDAEWERFQRDGVWDGEVELLHKQGHVIPVEARASRVELPDGAVFASVMRDISDRRQVEKMQREFTTLITHELKAPLTSLKGFAQLLQRRREYDDGAVEVILGRTNHLERLINDLLDVASTDSGKLSLRRANVDLVTIAGRNVEQARATTSAHEIRFTAPREAIVGWWDSGRLSQVLQNLLANAIKYSPYGGLIEVTIEAMDGVGRVIVSDDGIGIPAGALPHVFERFYRVEAVEHSTVQGLGIGLYIARTLVEAHEGQITATSMPGRGSTFTVSLPLSA